MDKQILSTITFGESIAELESARLQTYFIETEYWKNVRTGKIDVIYGSKGSGKSAIYSAIVNEEYELFGDRVLIASAENPSGNTAFSSLNTDPPTSFTEFVRLWKLYFLVIISQVLKDYHINDKNAQKVNQILEDCNLIPVQSKLASFIRSCLDFIRNLPKIKEISTTAEISETGTYEGQKFSISFNEPDKSEFEKGIISIESVYDLLTTSLKENGYSIWIIVDRLDVAFTENLELEANALKALFKSYLDLIPFTVVKLKIFLRDDIWRKITADGFREASHITKFEYLHWNRDSLLNLIIKRVLENDVIVKQYNLDKNAINNSLEKQEELFYRLFPAQIVPGAKRPKTLDWILTRTQDGKRNNVPREIIQLLNHAKELQIKKLEQGNDDLIGDQILSRASLKESMDEVSRQRVEQTLFSEYPTLKKYIELLRNDKAEQSNSSLAYKWDLDTAETANIIRQLVEIGFFEEKGTAPDLKYKIPFLYRPYLNVTQGTASDSSAFNLIDDEDDDL